MGDVGDNDGTVTDKLLSHMLQNESTEIDEANKLTLAEQQEAAKLQEQADKKGQGEYDHQRQMHEISKLMEKCDQKLEELKHIYLQKKMQNYKN